MSILILISFPSLFPQLQMNQWIHIKKYLIIRLRKMKNNIIPLSIILMTD